MKEKIASTHKTFISGMWFVHIVRQLVVTSGNIAESAFLLATLWMITNAVAHTLGIILYCTETNSTTNLQNDSKKATYLLTSAKI